jgi:hypothetical protein
MFESVNVRELAKIVQSVITTEAVSEGKIWRMNDHLRHKIRLAMFGPGRPNGGSVEVSMRDQRELLSQFSKMIAGPIIEALPADTAARAVVMLYEEFVDAVFVRPLCEADVGGGD